MEHFEIHLFYKQLSKYYDEGEGLERLQKEQQHNILSGFHSEAQTQEEKVMKEITEKEVKQDT